MARHVAVIDIGKTNAKLALVDQDTLAEISVVTRPNTVRPGPPWPHFDVEGLWAFLLHALAECHSEFGVDAISVTTHGACVALIGKDGKLAAPVLDYEYDGPDSVAEAYDKIRPGFDETGSPRLPGGLSVGAQLFWQFQTDPGLRDQIRHILTYPQYWGYRLTGAAATDMSSLGAHTDLWNPYDRCPSSLVDALGIADILAPPRMPSEVLGPVLPEILAQTGLAPDTLVRCGIHDSNASLLPHLITRPAPFGVVSTGTWVIVMAVGGQSQTMDPRKDTLVNVNAFGDPVPSARFMGGREYDMLTQGQTCDPTEADIAYVLEHAVMLLPALISNTGPFQGHKLEWTGGPEPEIGTGQRAVCIGFYLALVTAHCLNLVGHHGPIIVEGPFSKNKCYLQMLAAASGKPVTVAQNSTGTSQGAAMLTRDIAYGADAPSDPVKPIAQNPSPKFATYAKRWHAAVSDQGRAVAADRQAP